MAQKVSEFLIPSSHRLIISPDRSLWCKELWSSFAVYWNHAHCWFNNRSFVSYTQEEGDIETEGFEKMFILFIILLEQRFMIELKGFKLIIQTL